MDSYYVRAPSYSFSYLHMGSFETVTQKLYEVNIKNCSVSLNVICSFLTLYFVGSFSFSVASLSVSGELDWNEISIPIYHILTVFVSLLGAALGIFGYLTFSKDKIINQSGRVAKNARNRTDMLRKLFIGFCVVYLGYCGWYVYAMYENLHNEWSKQYGYQKMQTLRCFIMNCGFYCFMCVLFAQRVSLLHNYVTEYSLDHVDKSKKNMSLEYQIEKKNRLLDRRITEANEENEDEKVEFSAY